MKAIQSFISVFFIISMLSFPVFAETENISTNTTGKSSLSTKANLSTPEVTDKLTKIDSLLDSEKTWLDARDKYNDLLKLKLSRKDRRKVQSALEDLNMRILLSSVVTPDSVLYTVQPGDSLFVLAKKFHTTVDLIKKSNHMKSDTIQIGKKLKINQLKFSIKVDKSRNKLEVYANNKLFKTYPVATGRKNSTPVGTFTVETKIENPTWYKTGAVIPAGSPENILGTRWLGFSLEHYGIHGTTLPETIGTQASDGCVRMLNRDVEELYEIVPLKTTVTIVN